MERSQSHPTVVAETAAAIDDESVVWRTEPPSSEAAGGSGRAAMRRALEYRYQAYPFIALLGAVIIWEAVVRIYAIPPIYLPPPSAIVVTFVDVIQDGEFYGHLSSTLVRIFSGFVLGASSGIIVGLLMGRWRAIQSIADTFISMFYPLPKIALIPLLIVWFGLGDTYKIAISAFSAFFPVVISTYVGITQVDQKLKKAAVDLGCRGRRLYQRVIMPAALPSIMGGVRLGLGVSIILVIGAEMVGSSDGIGYLLIFAGQILQIQRVFAILVVLTIIGYVLLKAELLVEKRLMPWSSSQRGGVTI